VKYVNKYFKIEENIPNGPQNLAGIFFGKLAVID
jgi:hypothetical protein